MKRQRRLERINAIGREFEIAQLAAKHFLKLLRTEPRLLLDGKLKQADATRFETTLGDTYLLRLFAEFEEGLRGWWRHGLGRATEIRTFQLINSVAARRSVPDDDRDDVHAVREYRNALIHEESDDVDPVPFLEAKHFLCKFFSRLPENW
jgi:hypothetical protein